ncbi:hypothetical protein quinque_002680 [Culex quinquefasciatus]
MTRKDLRRSSDIDVYLNSFCGWQRKLNPISDADPVHFDHAVILTGLDLYVVSKTGKVSNQVVGLAPVAGMCTMTSSCTINEGKHFESVFVVSHEIGHKTSQSVCLFDRGHVAPNLDHNVEGKLPGERFDADQQCMLKYGKDSIRSQSQNVADICRDLHCQRDRYTWTSHPALEGTACGTLMCYNIARTTILEFANQICGRAKEFDSDILGMGLQKVADDAEDACKACDKMQSTYEYATRLCKRYQQKVRGLSGTGMQIAASVEDPDRSCRVACQDGFIRHRFYLVNGEQGHFPFGTRCNLDEPNRFCVNGKCLNQQSEKNAIDIIVADTKQQHKPHIPTPQELQIHTQSIIQNELLRKMLYEQAVEPTAANPAVQQFIHVTDLPYALREIVDLDGPAAVTAGARTTGIPRNRFKNSINYKGSLMSNPLSNILEIKIQRHFGLVGLNRQITNLKMEPGTTPSLPLAKNNSQMTDLGGLQTPPP